MKALPAGLDHLLTEYNVGNGFADRNPGWACGLLPCSSHSPPGRGAGGAKRLLFPYQAFPCSEGASLPGGARGSPAWPGAGLGPAAPAQLRGLGTSHSSGLGWGGACTAVGAWNSVFPQNASVLVPGSRGQSPALQCPLPGTVMQPRQGCASAQDRTQK